MIQGCQYKRLVLAGAGAEGRGERVKPAHFTLRLQTARGKLANLQKHQHLMIGGSCKGRAEKKRSVKKTGRASSGSSLHRALRRAIRRIYLRTRQRKTDNRGKMDSEIIIGWWGRGDKKASLLLC